MKTSHLFISLLVLINCVSFICSNQIADCCCSVSDVTAGGSNQQLAAQLNQLKKSTFFRTFKVNLHNECPFWQDSSQCALKGCEVCGECSNEIPSVWKDPYTAPVAFNRLGKDFHEWEDENECLWIVQDDISDRNKPISYINLQLNPEGFTGYTGFAPHRIWSAIYDENCFTGALDSMCYEQRVMYRLISGIHAEISSHIANHYPINYSDKNEFEIVHTVNAENVETAPNLEVYDLKLGKYPERINNLYFTFVFMARAVNKASQTLLHYNYSTGDLNEDQAVQDQIHSLLTSGLIPKCLQNTTFDENLMFSSFESQPLKRQFREHFLNISRIMDCVGCEKCKLHGKLIVLGVGTAMKILFNAKSFTLQRNEVMALLNSLSKFANAIRIVEEMEQRKHTKALYSQLSKLFAFLCVLLPTLALIYTKVFRRKLKRNSAAIEVQQTDNKPQLRSNADDSSSNDLRYRKKEQMVESKQ
jgi:ERO1-like protein alpha